jgi:phosphopantothenoylcysteine decarboxylase/phosphopantothenate--cysteine ligase
VLDALVLSTRVPVAVCPAMDGGMWEHPATQANVKTLADRGCRIWGPERGELASGKVGFGRMLEPDEIVRRALK